MKKTILLNNQEFHVDQTYLPILIHGEEGSGASLFTMSVLADLYSQGIKVIALTGFPMARDEFEKQTETNENVEFFTKEKLDEFAELIHVSFPRRRESSSINTNSVILVKNIELFDEQTFDEVKNYTNLIISGDINKCSLKRKTTTETIYYQYIFF